MRKFLLSVAAGAVVVASHAGEAPAAIVNGGFEAGFTGWDTIGNVSIVNSGVGSGPTEGIAQAALSTASDFSGGPASGAALAGFLGTTPGLLDAFVGSTVTQGSAIKQTLSVAAGDTIGFDFNFLTDELTAPVVFNDSAFVAINTFDILADTSSLFFTSPTTFADETDFLSFFEGPFFSPSVVTIGIGVVDVDDTLFPSALLVDNVSLTPLAVPEPSALALLGFGLVGIGLATRRRRTG